MKHFLITRFNLKVASWKTAKDGSAVLDDQWLENRFELFEKFCLPSVENQSNQNFIWVVFFDTDTPEKFRDRIQQISKNHKNFQTLYINGIVELADSFKTYIISQLEHDDQFILTTRLDNDDIIHRDFIQTIQNLSKKNGESLIDLRKGYQVNIVKKNAEIRKYNYAFNPFISVLENRNHFETIISRMHSEWENHEHIAIYNQKALWIELVHQKNKVNAVKRKLFMTRNIKLEDFSLEQKINLPGLRMLIKTNSILKIKRFIRILRGR